jgi:hypothetical protein
VRHAANPADIRRPRVAHVGLATLSQSPQGLLIRQGFITTVLMTRYL